MILQNWYNQVESVTKHITISQGIKTTAGNVYNSGWYGDYPQYAIYLMNFGVIGVGKSSYQNGYAYIGSGDTQPNINDYKLESVITTGFSGSREWVDGKLHLVITNTGNSDLIIREVGIASNVHTGTNSATFYTALIERSVLTTPLTIAPGDTGHIVYEIDFNFGGGNNA